MKKVLCLLGLFLAFSVNQANAGILVNDTIEPLLVTNMNTTDVTDLKYGEGRIVHVFGLVSSGFAGIQDIAKFNNITQIHHVDVRKKIILGCGVTTVQVFGE